MLYDLLTGVDVIDIGVDSEINYSAVIAHNKIIFRTYKIITKYMYCALSSTILKRHFMVFVLPELALFCNTYLRRMFRLWNSVHSMPPITLCCSLDTEMRGMPGSYFGQVRFKGAGEVLARKMPHVSRLRFQVDRQMLREERSCVL